MFLALDAEESGGTEYVDDAPVAEQADEQNIQVTGDGAYSEAEETASEPDDVVDAGGEEIIEADPETPSLDEALVSQWNQMGYPAEALGQFNSDDELRRAMAVHDAMALAPIRQKRGQAPPQHQPENAGQQQPPPTEGQTPAKLFEKLALNLEGWDPEAVKAINAINDHYGSALERVEAELRQRDERYSALEKTYAQQQYAAQQQQLAQENQQIESWFTSLGEEFADTFGKGEYGKFAPDSAELKARMELVQEAEALAAVDERLGRPPQEWKSLLNRALNSRYADKTKEIARKEIAQQVQERRKQSIARPSSRNGKPVTGVDKAIQRNRNFWKAAGHVVQEADSDNSADSLL